MLQRNNVTAFGEIAPLPGFSTETYSEAESVLMDLMNRHHELFRDGSPLLIKQALNELDLPASVRYGLDMLAIDLMAKLHACTITEILGLNSSDPLRVNGVIGTGSSADMLEQAETQVSAGYSTLKLKVGSDHKKELSLLEQLRKHYPDITIRLDANQAWEADEAIEKLNDFARFDVEYCEQPVSRHDPEGLGRVKGSTMVAVAADEAADSPGSVFELINRDLCDVLIIKPMIFGSVDELIVTKSLADTHNKRIVFTTSLESVVGRTMAAELAAGLGTATMAHGLSTGELLAEKVVQPEVINGVYRTNRGPGIQVEPDLQFHRLLK